MTWSPSHNGVSLHGRYGTEIYGAIERYQVSRIKYQVSSIPLWLGVRESAPILLLSILQRRCSWSCICGLGLHQLVFLFDYQLYLAAHSPPSLKYSAAS